MRHLLRSLETLIGFIVFVYFFPVFFWSLYAVYQLESKRSWSLVSIGLLLPLIGSTLLYIFFRSREAEVRHAQPHLAPTSQNEDISLKETELIEQLNEQNENLQSKIDRMQHQEDILTQEMDALKEQQNTLHQSYVQLHDEYHFQKNQLDKQIIEWEELDREQQKVIDQQRAAIEQKQQQIVHLENQIHDMRYEIKTLLQLAEQEPLPDFQKTLIDFNEFTSNLSSPIAIETSQKVLTLENASLLLKRCLEIAQRTSAGYSFTSSSRLKDLFVDHQALDLRQLFDSLKTESGALILFYSSKDEKVIFANAETKSLLGFSPEKFVQDFAGIVQEGMNEWKNSLATLAFKQEAHTRLLLKAKFNEDILVGVCLGSIRTGAFKGDAIAVVYPL